MTMIRSAAAIVCFVVSVEITSAVSPESISPQSVAIGKQLFEKTWTTRPPGLAGDGLGPLFNGSSCVACHHQGGVGGGGDSKFNAITIGIQRIDVTGTMVNADVVGRFLRDFHPGFGTSNTLVLPHHGGSAAHRTARIHMLNQVPTTFSEEGGSVSPAEVRASNATPILYTAQNDRYRAVIRARLYQRNTTALFGAGLIDRVTSKDIEAQVNLQRQHPEISGRPATLSSGRYGKFGWRGNIATLLQFVDQACAAELGLQTDRRSQPVDSMNPVYQNRSVDIGDQQIQAMRDFIAALPAPTRRWPEDSKQREVAVRGEQLFNTIGCSVCHPAQIGPVQGVYSDLLLHDMGNESIDLSHADPYIIHVSHMGDGSPRLADVNSESSAPEESSTPEPTAPQDATSAGLARQQSAFRSMQNYYGGSTQITRSSRRGGFESVRSRRDKRTLSMKEKQQRKLAAERHFFFEAPEEPLREFGQSRNAQLKYAATNFNQEWRTPPLWGVADSAPYLHDGRAATLLEAIAMHEGEAAGTRDRFLFLPLADREALLAFLQTLVAPPDAPPHE